MSIDITVENEQRLRATAQAEGVTVDAYLERVMNERDEFASVVRRVCERVTLSTDDARGKVERGFVQSERGNVVEGEEFGQKLLSELDDLEQRRRAG